MTFGLDMTLTSRSCIKCHRVNMKTCMTFDLDMTLTSRSCIKCHSVNMYYTKFGKNWISNMGTVAQSLKCILDLAVTLTVDRPQSSCVWRMSAP